MYLLVEVFPFDICRSELLESEIIVAELLAVSSFFWSLLSFKKAMSFDFIESVSVIESLLSLLYKKR